MDKLWRVGTMAVLMTLGLLGLGGPASAELVTKVDPQGVDVPNVKRITLDNRQKAAVVRMRYEDLSDRDDETFYIKWDSKTHYRVHMGEGGYGGVIYQLYLYKDGTSKYVSCSIAKSGDADEEVSGVRVPRNCLDKAPDKIRARGVGYADGGTTKDETPLTPYADRG